MPSSPPRSGDTCPHGDHPMACLECLETTPVKPATATKLKADVAMDAQYEGRCANRFDHPIEIGDRIYLIEGLGWVCDRCVSSR